MQVFRVFRMKATKEALGVAEADLERVTQDLRLPLLSDIRRQLSDIKEHVSNHPPPNVADIAASGAGEEEHQAAAEAAAAAGGVEADLLLDCADEELLRKTREVIDRGMMASNSMGSTVGEVIASELAKSNPVDEEAVASAAGAEEEENPLHAPTSATIGGLIARVWRVRFDKLTEKEFLGQGTFGKVHAGIYDGKHVAIKKARAPVFTAATLQDFRWVFCCFF